MAISKMLNLILYKQFWICGMGLFKVSWVWFD